MLTESDMCLTHHRSLMFAGHFMYATLLTVPNTATVVPNTLTTALPALILYGIFTTGYGVVFTYAFLSLRVERGSTADLQLTDTNVNSDTSVQFSTIHVSGV